MIATFAPYRTAVRPTHNAAKTFIIKNTINSRTKLFWNCRTTVPDSSLSFFHPQRSPLYTIDNGPMNSLFTSCRSNVTLKPRKKRQKIHHFTTVRFFPKRFSVTHLTPEPLNWFNNPAMALLSARSADGEKKTIKPLRHLSNMCTSTYFIFVQVTICYFIGSPNYVSNLRIHIVMSEKHTNKRWISLILFSKCFLFSKLSCNFISVPTSNRYSARRLGSCAEFPGRHSPDFVTATRCRGTSTRRRPAWRNILSWPLAT